MLAVFCFRKIGENYGHDDELCKKINLHNFKKSIPSDNVLKHLFMQGS